MATKYWRQQNIGGERNIWRRKNSCIDKILASLKIKNLALTKISRHKNFASTKCWRRRRRIPLLFWLGRVHSSWLIPDLAEDLLRLPDGVDPLACSRQVWRCLWPPAFMGGLPPALYRHIVSAHMQKMSQSLAPTKYRRLLKIHWFSPNYRSLYIRSQASYQKVVKTKSDHHYCPISVHILTTSKSEAVIEIHRWGLWLLKWGVGGRGGSPCCTSCPDNHSRRRVRQVAQDRGERGGLCTQDNSVHRSHVPLSLPFSFAFCLLFLLSHQFHRSALVLMLIRNKGFEYYQKLKSTALFGTDWDQDRITWGNPQKWCSDSLPLLKGPL